MIRLRLLSCLFWLAWAVAAVFGVGCKGASAGASAAVHDAGASVALTVRAETEGLLLTWIDDKGDFHVETRVADVPLMGRDTVRVVDPSKDAPDANGQLTVVDLRQAQADGTFPLRSMARTEFDALAVARREQKGPTLANATPPPSEEPPPTPSASAAAAAKPGKRAQVIIYGAEWCGACHEAARYLRHKGVAYVEKDIEKDAGAAKEMQEKLARNGLGGGSIPVIDVHGKVMVGFDAAAIDNALGAAL
jgi:glutaredoxin